MENRLKKIEMYFAQKIADCEGQYTSLWADERTDDAAFQKIQSNVYGIFRTILPVCIKLAGGDLTQAKAVFLEKYREITGNWVQALTLADEHRDLKRSAIEQTKMRTAEEIQAQFLRIWDGEA